MKNKTIESAKNIVNTDFTKTGFDSFGNTQYFTSSYKSVKKLVGHFTRLADRGYDVLMTSSNSIRLTIPQN
jgi:hypothetical protein